MHAHCGHESDQQVTKCTLSGALLKPRRSRAASGVEQREYKKRGRPVPLVHQIVHLSVYVALALAFAELMSKYEGVEFNPKVPNVHNISRRSFVYIYHYLAISSSTSKLPCAPTIVLIRNKA